MLRRCTAGTRGRVRCPRTSGTAKADVHPPRQRRCRRGRQVQAWPDGSRQSSTAEVLPALSLVDSPREGHFRDGRRRDLHGTPGAAAKPDSTGMQTGIVPTTMMQAALHPDTGALMRRPASLLSMLATLRWSPRPAVGPRASRRPRRTPRLPPHPGARPMTNRTALACTWW